MTMAEVSTQEDFLALAEPLRRELFAHCYRMLGSVHDAEDLVQETYLRAWRALDGFEGRSSLRTWLYRIATTACLGALEHRNRRPLPIGLGGPGNDADDALVRRSATTWLNPVPDALLWDEGSDPAAIAASRASVRLAFVAALQHLPPRQRAVLILREVLQWRAAEVAELLDITPAAVNSMVQRARSSLDRHAPNQDQLSEPADADQRELLDRYVTAFESKDINGLVELFTSEAVWEMPPYLGWYSGPEQIGRHLATRCLSVPGPRRLVATRANGQPAFATYLADPRGGLRLVNLQVLTLTGAGISHITAFADPTLFSAFDLPLRLRLVEASQPHRTP